MDKKIKFGWYRLCRQNILIYAFDGTNYLYYDIKDKRVYTLENTETIINALFPATLTFEKLKIVISDLEQEISNYKLKIKEIKPALNKIKNQLKEKNVLLR